MTLSLAWRYALLCVATHALFIAVSLVSGLRAGPLLEGDAITYLWPAQNLLQHGAFSREQSPPYMWEPYRTPGYPLLIAASLAIAGDPRWTLFAAAISAGAAGFCAVRLTERWSGGVAAQHVAGLAVALLPNSLGLSAFLLSDAIFGHLALVWLYLLQHGFARRSNASLVASALLLGVLQAIKPTLNIAGLLILAIALLYARSWRRWIAAGLLVALSLPLPIYFAARNAADHGVFTPTLLGVETAREYLQSRYVSEQTGVDYTTTTARIRAADRAAAARLSQPASLYGRLYRVKQAEVSRFAREQPLSAARLMFVEALRQLAAPQEFALNVFIGTSPVGLRALGSLLTLLIWFATAYGAWSIGRAGDWRPALLCAGVLALFLASGSISTLVGARLRFPADLAALPLASVGAVEVFSVARMRARRG